MQRWILAGIVALVLAIGGGGLGLRFYKQNRPDKVWVPLPINGDLSLEKRRAMTKELEQTLRQSIKFAELSKDVGLSQKWQLASDEEGGREIEKRLFVKLGDADTPTGRVPAIHIGVNGKVKEHAVLGALSVRLVDEVRRVLKLSADKSQIY